MNQTVQDVSAAVGALLFVMILMAIWMTVLSIRFALLKHRLRKSDAMLASHQRALISMHVAGMLSDDDWERATTPLPRKRRTLVIEPRIPAHYYPKPPVGPSGGSDARGLYPPPGTVPAQSTLDAWAKPPTVGPKGGAGNSGAYQQALDDAERMISEHRARVEKKRRG